LLWLILGGFIAAVLWTICGLLMIITIIGIPFGLQALKLAGFTFWPFGREVEIGNFGIGGALGNVIWVMLFGWELAVYHVLLALLFTITIIGFWVFNTIPINLPGEYHNKCNNQKQTDRSDEQGIILGLKGYPEPEIGGSQDYGH